MMKLLVLCTGNSCRSQMAEGFLRGYGKEFGLEIEVISAGIEAHGVNPKAIQVMQECGINISQHTSDLVTPYINSGVTHLFSVCNHAQESCPVFPEDIIRIHYSFPDPAKAIGSEKEILDSFRATRDEIDNFCRELLINLFDIPE